MKRFNIFNLIFLAFGISSIAIDPLIPYISETLQIGYDKIGVVLLIGSVFSLVSTLLSGIFSDHLDIKKVILTGLILLFFGFLIFGIHINLIIFLIVLILLRSGYGTIDSSIHAYISHIHKKDRSFLFLRLDIFWFLGAVLGPLAIGGALILGIDPQFVFLLFTVVFFALIISFSVSRKKLNGAGPKRFDKVFNFFEFGRAIKNSVVVLTSLLLFFMMGAQIGLSTWFTAYFTAFGLDISYGSLILSLYWAFSALGLYFGMKLLPRSNEITLLIISCAAGTIFLAASSFLEPTWIKVLFLMAQGLSISVIFALSISVSAQENNRMKGTIMGLNISSALLGGVVFQPILGFVAEYAGSQYTIFAILAGSILGTGCAAALFYILFKKYRIRLKMGRFK